MCGWHVPVGSQAKNMDVVSLAHQSGARLPWMKLAPAVFPWIDLIFLIV